MTTADTEEKAAGRVFPVQRLVGPSTARILEIEKMELELLGDEVKGPRGFASVQFADAYDKACSLQASSAIGEYEDSFERPGTSFVWLGLNDAEPQVMAVHAAAVGVKTAETVGWVEYPIPQAVHVNTRMHLSREQVQGLIQRMQAWLDTGSFRPNAQVHRKNCHD